MATPAAPPARAPWHLGRGSIRLQLTVLVLLVVLPTFGAILWHLVDERERDRRMAIDRVRQIADNVSARLSYQVGDYANTLTLIASQPRVRAMTPGQCDPLIVGQAHHVIHRADHILGAALHPEARAK